MMGTFKTTFVSLVNQLDVEGIVGRWATIDRLKSEAKTLGTNLGEQYRDGILNESEVRAAIRAHVQLLTHQHNLTMHERVDVSLAAHNVSGIPQF